MESGFEGSSRGSTWRERRHKRHEDRDCEWEEERSGLGEGSYQTNWMISSASRHGHFDKRDEEHECLHRLVRDLELEVRGRRRRKDPDDQEEGSTSGGGCYGVGFNQSGSCRHRDSRSWEYADRDSDFPEERWPRNAAMDAMSHALHKATRSLFLDDIERAPMQSRFTRPLFNSYNRKTDSIEHVSHYIQMISLHTHNDALMCKVFPSSLRSTALRWFNGLRKSSIHNFAELIQEFDVRFVTCSRVPQPVDALLYMKMREGETLCSYVSRYWELYNEISGGN